MTTRGRTPTLQEVIRRAIDARLNDVHTAMPAVVVSYDATSQKANVQPQLQRKFKNDNLAINLPVITNVPVVFPRSGQAFISFPVKAGDQVMLIFSERSLDRWLDSGGIVDPADRRKFHLSDAVALPGLYPFSDTVAADPDDILIKNGDTELRVKNNGKFELKNATEELLDLFDQFLDAVLAAKTNTLLGPQPLVPPTLFTDIKTKLATLKV